VVEVRGGAVVRGSVDTKRLCGYGVRARPANDGRLCAALNPLAWARPALGSNRRELVAPVPTNAAPLARRAKESDCDACSLGLAAARLGSVRPDVPKAVAGLGSEEVERPRAALAGEPGRAPRNWGPPAPLLLLRGPGRAAEKWDGGARDTPLGAVAPKLCPLLGAALDFTMLSPVPWPPVPSGVRLFPVVASLPVLGATAELLRTLLRHE
jgi:hypothetical protein